jgi:ABC-type lipoprotein export system ATPase subunit
MCGCVSDGSNRAEDGATIMSGDLLRLEAVTKAFAAPDGGQTSILEAVDCLINPGEAVAIVGPSGSGKSTLLNLIGSLEPPTSGRILLGDTEINTLSGQALAQFRAMRVGFVFQEHHLLPQLTALENVLLPTLCVAAKADASVASDLLDRVGLTARRDAFPAQLSGGERQRVAVARALTNSPSVLLCDEPTGNLDRVAGAEVVSLLLQLASQQGATVLMVTHNLEQAKRFGRVLELSGGKLTPRGEMP